MTLKIQKCATHIEAVALHDLGRRVVEVVMRLVVLVPLEARLHAVEVSRLARLVLVRPEVGDLKIIFTFSNDQLIK